MILAGDVGGTKVHLALYNFEGGRLKPVRDEKVAPQEFATLDALVNKFLRPGEREQIVAACFGCPGPVRNGRLKLTNLSGRERRLSEPQFASLTEDRLRPVPRRRWQRCPRLRSHRCPES